jgi:hypothetical protein
MKKIIGSLGCGVILITSSVYGAVFFYQEPGQYVMAQAKPVQYVTAQTTNSEPAVKPVLDIRGIKEIQSIPVGEMREYFLKGDIEELGLEGWIPLEVILESIANLALMQMGLGEQVQWSIYREENPLSYGTFGWALQEILGVDPERDFGLTVEHTDFIQTPGATPECDEDHYLLTINCRQIKVILVRGYGWPEKGFDWGVRGLLLRQHSEKEFAPNGLPHTEEKELAINIDKDTGKFYALYTIRIIKSDDGTLLKGEQKKFVEGSPEPVEYAKF